MTKYLSTRDGSSNSKNVPFKVGEIKLYKNNLQPKRSAKGAYIGGASPVLMMAGAPNKYTKEVICNMMDFLTL